MQSQASLVLPTAVKLPTQDRALMLVQEQVAQHMLSKLTSRGCRRT